MRFRKMFVALVACLALAAVAANAAQAEGTCWTIEGVCLAGGGKKEPVKIERHPGSAVITFTSALLGKIITIDANKVECAAGTTCTIDNTTSPNHSEGKLEFTEVTVTEPANCTVHTPGKASGTLTTNLLTDTVIMDPLVGSAAVFDRFFTDGAPFFELEFTGAKCVFDELVVEAEGTLTGRAVFEHGTEKDVGAKTGEQRVIQSLTFNRAEQETGGGSFTLGGQPTYLDATVDASLNGIDAGKNWGSD